MNTITMHIGDVRDRMADLPETVETVSDRELQAIAAGQPSLFDPPQGDRMIRPPSRLDPFEQFIESGAALDHARRWLTDEHLLDAYLADRASDTAFKEWCDEQIREGLAERARLEAG